MQHLKDCMIDDLLSTPCALGVLRLLIGRQSLFFYVFIPYIL